MLREKTGAVRAAIYIRVSDLRQARRDRYSLETQLTECLSYCTERGYVVDDKHVYRDVHTAVELYERPNLTLLRKDMNENAFDVIVVHQFDRFSREPRHCGVLLTEAKYANVGVESVLEGPFDGESGDAERIFGMKGFAAKQEWNNLRERAVRGRMGRINSGKYPAGWKPPFGFEWADGNKTALLKCPLTAPIVERIFRRILEGTSCRRLAFELDADRLATPSGRVSQKGECAWQANTVRQIVLNPTYSGKVAAYRWQTTKVNGKKITRERPRDEWVWIEGIAPPFVTEDQQARAISLIQSRKREPKHNAKSVEEPLLRTGYARCAHCGTALTPRNGHYTHATTQRDRHGCPPISISCRVLDEIAWQKIHRLLLDSPATIKEVLEFSHEPDPHEMDETSTRQRLESVERQISNYARSLGQTDDDLVRSTILEAMSPLHTQRRELLIDLAGLATKRALWQQNRAMIDDFVALLEQLASRTRGVTYEEKRLALHALKALVLVRREGMKRYIHVRLGLPIEFPDDCQIVEHGHLTRAN